MKKAITICIYLGFITCVWATTDPNTPIVPPRPGAELWSVVDSQTLRITTSKDIKKFALLSQRKRCLLEIERLEERIKIINAKLAKFK